VRVLSYLLLAAGVLAMLAPLAPRGLALWEQRRLLAQFDQVRAGVRLGRPSGSATAVSSGPTTGSRTPPSTDDLAPRRTPSRPPALAGDEPASGNPVPSGPDPAPAEPPPAQSPTVTYRITIPDAGVRYMVMPDIENEDLARGPSHYPQTALPGQAGNAAIAGHRTHRGEPSYFYHLDRLKPGSRITIDYPDRSYVYMVERVFITNAYDLSVLDPTPYPALTLTTCDPPGTEDNRLIVRARLIEGG
jgi:sortase A